MTILVTGGAGLVGSHVIEALRARAEAVRALVRPAGRAAVERLGAEAVDGDVTDPGAWRRAADGVRGIIHAAAIVVRRARLEDYLAVNVGGTRLAIDAARRAGVRMVHISSVAVYGGAAADAGGRGPVTEDTPFQELHPLDFYARSKRASEEVVRAGASVGGLSAVVLRPNVIYGERDRLFTAKVVRIVRRGILPLIGPGTNRLSCVYAGNVAAAAVAALDAPVRGFRAFNVTADAPPALTQREFLTTFAEALGVRPLRLPLPLAAARLVLALLGGAQRLLAPGRYRGFGRAALVFLTGDNPYVVERARRELAWSPPFSTREAIRRTAAHFAGT